MPGIFYLPALSRESCRRLSTRPSPAGPIWLLPLLVCPSGAFRYRPQPLGQFLHPGVAPSYMAFPLRLSPPSSAARRGLRRNGTAHRQAHRRIVQPGAWSPLSRFQVLLRFHVLQHRYLLCRQVLHLQLSTGHSYTSGSNSVKVFIRRFASGIVEIGLGEVALFRNVFQ